MTPDDDGILAPVGEELNRLHAEIDRLREELKESHENNRALLLSSVPKEELLACQRELKAAQDHSSRIVAIMVGLEAKLKSTETRAEQMRTLLAEIIEAFRQKQDLKSLIYSTGKALDMVLAGKKEKANG